MVADFPQEPCVFRVVDAECFGADLFVDECQSGLLETRGHAGLAEGGYGEGGGGEDEGTPDLVADFAGEGEDG